MAGCLLSVTGWEGGCVESQGWATEEGQTVRVFTQGVLSAPCRTGRGPRAWGHGLDKAATMGGQGTFRSSDVASVARRVNPSLATHHPQKKMSGALLSQGDLPGS